MIGKKNPTGKALNLCLCIGLNNNLKEQFNEVAFTLNGTIAYISMIYFEDLALWSFLAKQFLIYSVIFGLMVFDIFDLLNSAFRTSTENCCQKVTEEMSTGKFTAQMSTRKVTAQMSTRC